MFGIGTTELIIVFAILLIIFGSSRLPGLGKGLGQAIRGFRDTLRDANIKEAETELKKDLEKEVREIKGE